MSAASRVSSVVTSRYANALLELAEENKAVDKIEGDMKDLLGMLQDSPDLEELVTNPRIGKSNQQGAIEALAKKAKFHKLTTNFLYVLIENRRLNILGVLAQAVLQEMAVRRGEKTAQVRVAQDLTDKQIKELEASLSKASGSPVTLDIEVDPSLLGGMVVTMDSRMVDDSVAGKLARLKLAMGQSSNENTNPNSNSKNLSEVS
ncbi:MAG: F0F1 ATP synthase subunit delta [Alphaproteobacteria bacterium]